jgi:hypothetical protein
MARFCIKLVSFLLSVTNTLAWTNTLAFYGIRKLQVCSVFIAQAADVPCAPGEPFHHTLI